MTWDEFKTKVEAELEKEGKDGSTEIYYMEFFGYQTIDPWIEEDGKLSVF